MEKMKPLVYRGKQEICAAVGISWQNMAYYIEKKDLPVFKIDGCKTWLALPDDLKAWVKVERDKKLKKKR